MALRMRPPPGAATATLKGAQDWLTEADGAVEQFPLRAAGGAVPGGRVPGRGGRPGPARDPALGGRSDRRHRQLRPRPAALLRVPGAAGGPHAAARRAGRPGRGGNLRRAAGRWCHAQRCPDPCRRDLRHGARAGGDRLVAAPPAGDVHRAGATDHRTPARRRGCPAPAPSAWPMSPPAAATAMSSCTSTCGMSPRRWCCCARRGRMSARSWMGTERNAATRSWPAPPGSPAN